MTDNDKILINAYLDNELSDDESRYVAELLENDSEALEFANALKVANNSLDTFFKSEEINSLRNKVDGFIESHIENNESFVQRLYGSLINIKYSGPIAVFALAGILFLPTYLDDDFSDPNLKVYTYSAERSEAEEKDIFDLIPDAIESMIAADERISKILVTTDKDEDITIYLKLTKKKNECWRGYVKNEGSKRYFSYCPTTSNNKITFD